MGHSGIIQKLCYNSLTMQSPERFNPDNQDNLWRLREQANNTLGKPHPVAARILTWQYKGPLEKTLFDPLFSDKNRLRKHLARLKDLYSGSLYCRPLTCAYQVNYAKEAIMAEAKAAVSFAAQNDPFKFAVLFDIACGMGLVANSVYIAEGNLRDPSQTELSNVVDYHAERLDLNPVENAEVFLRSKQFFSRFAELLKKDNSGLLLIKEVVKSLKDLKSSKKRGINIPMSDHQVPELVVAGAELGEKLYKKLYPLTD